MKVIQDDFFMRPRFLWDDTDQPVMEIPHIFNSLEQRVHYLENKVYELERTKT